MQGIQNKSVLDFNIGSVRDLLFLPLEYVSDLGSMSDGVYDVNAIVTTAEAWFRIEFVRETCKLVQEHANGVNGPFVKITLSFSVAKNMNHRWAQMMDMREREYLVVVIDTNNKGYIIGDVSINGEKRGARLFVKTDTGSKYTDRNDLDYYFYMEAFNYAFNASYTEPPTIHYDAPVITSDLPPLLIPTE